MATYKYNLEERLGIKNSGNKKNASENKSAKSGSTGNAKKNYGVGADDPYNLYGRLYGHTDQSIEVVGGVNKRAGTADAIESQFIGDYLYSPNAWQSNQYANAKNRTNEFMGEVGDAISYYNTYPDEFGDELEAAKKQDANTYARAAYVNNTLAARTGDTSVLEGKKGQEKRDLQGLNNLYEYDKNVAALADQNGTQNFEELAELSKNFNLQDALLTIEDYYRGLYTPVMGDGLSAASVDRADFAKAASDVERFTGIDVRGLKREEVEEKLQSIADMSDTVDYMQNWLRWETERRNAEAALGNWEEEFTKNWGGLRDAPDYDELSRTEKKKASFWSRNEYSDKDYWHPNEVYPAQAFPETYSGIFDFMTEEQLRDFTYLYNQPDDGAAQAKAYLEDLAPDLLRKRAKQQVAAADEFASKNGLTGTAAFLAARGANLVNSLVGATDMLATPFKVAASLVYPSFMEADPNSAQYDFLRYAQAFDKANLQNIAQNSEWSNVGDINVMSEIYKGASSASDSLLSGIVYGPAASAAMGANAYSSARFEGEDMLDSGMQALFEALTEKYSLDTMFGDTGSIVKAITKNALVEPTEELANMALNIGWDRLRYGENDAIGKRFAELRAKGYSEYDASIQIASEYGREALATWISSTAAGGIGGAVGGTMNAIADKSSGENIISHGTEAVQSVLDLATKLPLDSDMAQIAKDLSAAAQKGEQLNAAKLGRVLRESLKVVDENSQQVVQNTASRYIKGELRRNGVNDREITDAVVRIVSDNGTATPHDYDLVAKNDGALSVVRSMTDMVERGRELEEEAATIAEKAATKAPKDKQTNVNDNVTDNENDIEPASEADELATAEVPTDEAVIAQHITESASEYADNADLVAVAYKKGQDVDTFNTQFRRAFEFGEEGRNYDTISKSDTLSGLTPAQIQVAYKMGRDQRIDRAKQAAKERKGLVKVGNIDTSAIRDMKLNETQRSATRAISKLAQAVGFNVKYIANTADAQGKISGKNGSWDKATRTITIDINAGRLSSTDTNYAIMQTAGHELTHFIKEFADTELFAQYQDFVFSHLSEKMTEADLDGRIAEYIDRWSKQGATIDRDGAIEEIVADASGDVLLKMTEADIQQLSEQNPGLLKKIGDFIQKWVKDVKTLITKAYQGQTARNAIAEQMVDAADELGRKWNDLLKNAAANAHQTAQEATQETAKAKESQPVEAGRFLAYGHIDRRTTDTIRNTDTQLFASEVEEAQIGFAAAAQMLLSDLDNTVSGQKFFTEDGVTGQKRMTSSFLASMKDATGWTWDKIRSSLEQFAAMQTSDTLPKNTVANREMELYLDEVLSNGYTTIDGQKVAPWDEYVEAKNQYKGSSGEKALQSAYENAIDFADYAFADVGEKFSVRHVNGNNVVWIDEDITKAKPKDQKYTDFIAEYLTNHVDEVYTIMESGRKVYLGEDLPSEYTGSKYTKRIRNKGHETFYAKNKMAAGLGEAIEIATDRRWEKTKHPDNKDAKYGIYKYSSKIAFPSKDYDGKITNVSAYDVVLVIRNASDGRKYLYEVEGIKNDAISADSLLKRETARQATSAVKPQGITSANSIAEKGEEVKFSMRAPASQTNTPEFHNWFKDSKIINTDGTPKVMYHGSPNDFTAFDIKKAKSSGLYGKGFYFTDSESHGGTYGKLYEVYLSIQHPLTPGGDTVTRTQVRKFLEAVAENEDDYSIENYGTYDVNEILSSVYRKDAFAVIQDVSATAIGDLVEAVKLFNEVNGTKFDGIVVDTETVAFEPTQIKSATDNIGTFDPENADIRYQLRNPDQISDRVLLSNVMESAATNALELDQVKRYRQHIEKLNEKQAELEKTNQDIVNARKEGRKADAVALRSKADILEKQIAREDGMLLKYEAAKPLQAVVARERAAMKRKADERVKAYAAKRVETVRKQEAEKREKLNQKLAEVREKRDQKIAQLRQEKQDAVKKVRDEKDESFGKSKYRKRIEEDVAKLRTWVTSPTNKEHVPQFLRGPMGDLINALDFSSTRSLNGGEITQKDAKLAAALDAMNLALTKIRSQQEGLDKGAASFATMIDLPYGYVESFAELVADIKETMDATRNAGDIPINRMTAAELKELSIALRTLTTSIRQMNRLLSNARYESAVNAAGDTIADLGKMTPKAMAYKAVDAVQKFMDWTNTVPYYAFKRFGRGGKAIFDGLMDGWDKLAFNSDKLVKFADKTYTKKEVKKWSAETRKVDLSNGETVTMTTAQLMSLYCLAKRAQAVGHLLGGGIRIADIDSKGKRLVQSENYTLTDADLQMFSDMLTDRQRQVADALQEFMSTQGAEWGNEISMKRFGYEMFTERFYFPIETDANNRLAIDEQAQENSLFRLLNMSATKGLVKGANNALVVRDIFDVFTAHTSDMAKYNAMALPILDALKWLNYVEKTQNDDGTLTTKSVQKSLERAYGTDARQYIIQLIRDLNGVKEGGTDAGFINKLTSNAKVASVGANIRVYLLQATSLPRALYVTNIKNLSIGVAKMLVNPVKAVRLAKKKVGIAMWKSMGFYDTNISRSVRQMVKYEGNALDWIREKSMAPAGVMDSLTMGVLYYTAEAECKKKYRNTPVGSEAWNKLVNDRVREIVYQTQVVDSTMTRSAAMRSQNELLKQATNFMSEPTLALNMLMDSVYEARMNHRAGESLKAPTAKMVKAMIVFTITAVLTAALESLFDAERDDDEYEEFDEKFMMAFIGDLTENDTGWQRFTKILFSNVGSNLNPINNVPVLNEFMSIAEGYDNQTMWSQFAGSIKKTFDAYNSWQAGKGEWYNVVYNGLKGVSQMVGLPINNASREAISIWNTFFADPLNKPRIQTYGNNNSDAAEAYYEAITGGDTERAEYILKRAKINGIDEGKIADAIATYAKNDFIDGKITEAVARKYLSSYAKRGSDKIDTNIRDWSYQRETGFKYSEMKSDYIAGNITKSQMQTLLMRYRGYDSDEVYWQLSKWDYEKTNGTEGGKYDWFLDAVDVGYGYEKYAQDLLNHGVKKGDIASAIASAYKDAYLEIKGTPEGDRMLEYLLDVYESIGYDREYERKYIAKNWK